MVNEYRQCARSAHTFAFFLISVRIKIYVMQHAKTRLMSQRSISSQRQKYLTSGKITHFENSCFFDSSMSVCYLEVIFLLEFCENLLILMSTRCPPVKTSTNMSDYFALFRPRINVGNSLAQRNDLYIRGGKSVCYSSLPCVQTVPAQEYTCAFHSSVTHSPSPPPPSLLV